MARGAAADSPRCYLAGLKFKGGWEGLTFPRTYLRIIFPPPAPKPTDFLNLDQKEKSLLRKPGFPSKGVKVLETAVGTICAPTRFSLVRISIRDLVADGKSLVRSSGVGGGGQNGILTIIWRKFGHKKMSS